MVHVFSSFGDFLYHTLLALVLVYIFLLVLNTNGSSHRLLVPGKVKNAIKF